MAGLHRIARLCVHLLDLRGYVGLSSADEVPHGFTRKSRLRSGEFFYRPSKKICNAFK